MCGESNVEFKPVPCDNVVVENYLTTAIGYKMIDRKNVDGQVKKVVKVRRMYLSTRGFFVDDPSEAACFSDPRAAHEFLHSCPMDITPTNGYKLIPHTISYRPVTINYTFRMEEGGTAPALCFGHQMSNKFVDANGNEIRRSIEPNGSLAEFEEGDK